MPDTIVVVKEPTTTLAVTPTASPQLHVTQVDTILVVKPPTITLAVTATPAPKLVVSSPGPQGVQGIQGIQGIQGPTGPQGGGQALSFTQVTPATHWVIPHGLGREPVGVTVTDTARTQLALFGMTTSSDLNTTTLEFAVAQAGTAEYI